MLTIILILLTIAGIDGQSCSSRFYETIKKDGPSLSPDEIISSHKVEIIDVKIDSLFLCEAEIRCVGFNYRMTSTNDENCQLTNVIKNRNTTKRGDWILLGDKDATKREENRKTKNDSGNPVFKSCLDVQTYNNTVIDGEYPLQIRYPTCNQTVQIYCADMNTSKPREYLTLKAGPENNFSKKTYVSSIKENSVPSSETQFAKIRIVSNLTVQRDDFRFATVTWYHLNQVYYTYAAAEDCHAYSCSGTKLGVFKMDLTGTGMKFVTPIDWEYFGYHTCKESLPNQHSVSATKQVVSGHCGGYCAGCNAKNLKLEPAGC